MRNFNVYIMIILSITISCIIVYFNINIMYSNYLPAVFFSIGLSTFALRLTITTSFTEKIPQDDVVIKNLKFFNKSLERFIIYSMLFGASSVILYPIYFYSNGDKNNLYGTIALLHYWYKILSASIILTLLQYIMKGLLSITYRTTSIINAYIDETNSRYKFKKYQDQSNKNQ